MLLSYDAAYHFLDQDRYHNLAILGALEYDSIGMIRGAFQGSRLVAVGVLVEQDRLLYDDRPTVMVSASGSAGVEDLLQQKGWPERLVWSTSRLDLRVAIETCLGCRHDSDRGLHYYMATSAPVCQHTQVRAIIPQDAERLDLAPCSLSPSALLNWLKRGWRMFGAVSEGRLLCHALAAYPISDTEEISAVYTAPYSRQQGLARAVVAATAVDIIGRNHRAVYVTTRANIASQRVAEGLELSPLFETWEIPSG